MRSRVRPAAPVAVVPVAALLLVVAVQRRALPGSSQFQEAKVRTMAAQSTWLVASAVRPEAMPRFVAVLAIAPAVVACPLHPETEAVPAAVPALCRCAAVTLPVQAPGRSASSLVQQLVAPQALLRSVLALRKAGLVEMLRSMAAAHRPLAWMAAL